MMGYGALRLTHHRRLLSIRSLTTMLLKLNFIRQFGGADRIVWIDVLKFNSAWRRDRGYYISRNGPNRTAPWIVRLRFRKIPMPHVYVGEDGEVSFTDGRHRFAWFRDNGVRAMPVTVATNKEAEIAKRLFGSRRRSIQIDEDVFRNAFVIVAKENERRRNQEALWRGSVSGTV